MVRQCSTCDERPAGPLRRCAGCANAWYCGKACQRSAWVFHIFECNPRRPINTADHLALAVYKDLIPEDQEIRQDYGFTRAFTSANTVMLFGLYVGLIKHMDIPPQRLHKWRIEGDLVVGIKDAFSKLPTNNRGGYYPWFIENQYVLDHTLSPPPNLTTEWLVNGWTFIGGSPTDSLARQQAITAEWPEAKQESLHLYQMLLAGWRPAPSLPIWVSFGFCAVLEFQEWELSTLYIALIHKCTFEEFWTAHEASNLLNLMHSWGLDFQLLHTFPVYLTDVLDGPLKVFKSVWWLKQFVCSDAPIQPSVYVDYGFCNANDEETEELKEVYKLVFCQSDWNPIKLHEAAIAGKLFEHVGGIVKLKKKFKKLMKTVYPLPS